MSDISIQRKTKPTLRQRWGSGQLKKHLAYLCMLLPGFTLLFIFAYMPLPAVAMAFKSYRIAVPPADFWLQNTFLYSLFYNSEWVGMYNFQFMLGSPDFAIFMRNTLGYNLLFMTLGLCCSVGIAVGIHELRQRFAAKFYHTVLFMPYFLSWIIVTYVVYAFVSANGLINRTAAALGLESTNLYSQTTAWPFIFVMANIWRYAGNGSIIYLATITGFDSQLYEAAAIDGAGKWKQFLHITLPQLVPTIIILQILAVGRILNADFDMFYNLPNGSGTIRAATLTLDTYVYAALKTGQNLGLPSAAAFFQSLVGFTLVLLTNGIVRKVRPEMAMF